MSTTEHEGGGDCAVELAMGEGTGLVYDESMAEHRSLWDSRHPECPERLTASYQRCVDYGLVNRCVRIPARSAEEAEVLALHDQAHLDQLKQTNGKTDAEALEALCARFDSIYIHPKTYELALLAVGCTVDLVTAVVKGTVRNGMALVRPPGHHAMRNEYCGYCFFNNVALAAQHALDNLNLNKVLIVDWDVHHGQATQYAFYEDRRVLYFSVHRYEHGEFWPELRESDFPYVGKGAGAGYNINVPLNQVGLGNADYLAIWHQLLLPVAYEFQPELVLISAGYDAALGCPEGLMRLSPAAYAHLLHPLMALAGGRLCVVLEGGYCVPSLAEGVALTLRTLLGEPCPSLPHPLGDVSDSVMETLLNCVSVLRPHWKSLCAQGTTGTKGAVDGVEHVPKSEYRGQLGVKRPEQFPTRSGYYEHLPEDRQRLEAEVEALRSSTNLDVPPRHTAMVYDARMTEHRCLSERGHPERPERISKPWEVLGKRGLLDQCLLLDSRSATIEELLLIHDKEYVHTMRSSQDLRGRDLIELQERYSSLYLCRESFSSALLAAGSLLQLVDAVCMKKCVNGMALIRPPGHHAERDVASGFCLFNNMAIAARHALDTHGLQRILLVDWDVHHGNGIQHAFYDDPRVLYVSLHRYDHGMFFPCSSDADFGAVGKDDGQGFNINVAWNKDGICDADYLAAFFHLVLPVAYAYAPDLVLVSCGFDSCVGDPLGHCRVTPDAYAHLTHLLLPLANGRVILALEGGYNLSKLPSAVCHCVGALLGHQLPQLRPAVPTLSAVESIRRTMGAHRRFWPCLRSSGYDLPTKQWLESSSLLPDGEPQLDLAALSLEESEAPYCIVPETWCPHLDSLPPLPPGGLFDPKEPCITCGVVQEVWVCLHCFQPQCSRYVNGHMLDHHAETQHPLVLSYADLSVWCYTCNFYVSNPVLQAAKEDVYLKKFGSIEFVL
uniref:Protein deacetylase HDAC6 n=1 Tax=Amblyomma triste TaxID=251400 RepID=A0A023GDE3_AMBTT